MRLGSATALYDALFLGSEALEPRQGRKVMVVITDGGDTMSKVNYKEAVRAAETAEAILYSIIVVPIEASAGRDTGGEHALIQLSADTGGKYFYASSLAQLDQAFAQISDELRTQYLLAYYPSQRLADLGFPAHPGERQRSAAGLRFECPPSDGVLHLEGTLRRHIGWSGVWDRHSCPSPLKLVLIFNSMDVVSPDVVNAEAVEVLTVCSRSKAADRVSAPHRKV